MTNEDIIRMAREAGMPETATEGVFIANSDDLGRLIAAEREACAKTAMELLFVYIGSYPINEQFADAIRARGNV